jgi:hypothetical protein
MRNDRVDEGGIFGKLIEAKNTATLLREKEEAADEEAARKASSMTDSVPNRLSMTAVPTGLE